MNSTGPPRQRKPFFSGAYVPTGASGMVQLSVWAAIESRPRPVVAAIEWHESGGELGALDTDATDHVAVQLTNLQVLGGLADSSLEVAMDAVAGWVSRALAPLALDGTIETRFDESRAADAWGHRTVWPIGVTAR